MKKLLLLRIISLGALGVLSLSTLAAQTVDSSPRGQATFTVGTLPTASSWTNKTALVTDGSAAGDCTVGSGSTRVLCVSNGSTWAAVGGGGGVVQTAIVTVSAAQIKTLNASPVTIVAAQGAGTYIQFVSAVVEFVCNSCTQYTSGNTLTFQVGGAWMSSGFAGANFDSLSGTTIIDNWTSSSPTSLGDKRNSALVFVNPSTPEYATGTGTLIIHCNYIVHSGL